MSVHVLTIDDVLDDMRIYANAHAVSPDRLRSYFLIGIYAEGRLVPSAMATQAVVAWIEPEGQVRVDVEV